MPSAEGYVSVHENTGSEAEISVFTAILSPFLLKNMCSVMPAVKNSSKRAQIEAEEKFRIHSPFEEKPFIMLVLDEF